jgi:hypothetical protein
MTNKNMFCSRFVYSPLPLERLQFLYVDAMISQEESGQGGLSE